LRATITWQQHANAEIARQRDLDRSASPPTKRMEHDDAHGQWFYSPPLNSINFPAGILQLSVLRSHRDMALNYGPSER